MTDNQPTVAEWKDLFAAALEFKETKPWEWMMDRHTFGVENPEDGEIGYVCIMGRLGELYGLAVYRGAEGLYHYENLSNGNIHPEDPENMFRQNALLGTFHDREELSSDERNLIKELGLKIRGKKAYPVFVSELPGFAPCKFNAGEARFLTHIFRQAKEFSLRFLKNPLLLVQPEPGHLYLVQKQVNGVWKEEWRAVKGEPPKAQPFVLHPVDELRVMRLKKQRFRKSGPWEADIFFMPQIIMNPGGRDYYFQVFMMVDQASSYILAMDGFEPGTTGSLFQEIFLRAIEITQSIPSAVYLKDTRLAEALAPVAKLLDIPLKIAKKFAHIPAIRQHMSGMMRAF